MLRLFQGVGIHPLSDGRMGYSTGGTAAVIKINTSINLLIITRVSAVGGKGVNLTPSDFWLNPWNLLEGVRKSPVYYT